MLAGAYSKQYQTLEKEHLNTLRTVTYDSKIDVLARAKKLSNETNKRRKAQAVKRRNEGIKEEKRRQEILSKRHEEQKAATERFQRSHVPNSRPTSSKNYRYSPAAIDEALKLVRGGSPVSRQNSYTHHGGRTSPLPAGNYPSNPLCRPYFNKHKNQHNSSIVPSNGQTPDHGKLKDKSLQNWNDSKSLFEQQLEQHQLLLLDEQQKSLYQFNEAISNEIAQDEKINGTEERDVSPVIQSESLSSVDSLDESFNNKHKQKEHHEPEPQDLLAHNLIYPISLGGGIKGGFYLETKNKTGGNENTIYSNSTPTNIPLSYSDIKVQNNSPGTTLSNLSQPNKPNSGIGTVPVSNNNATVKPTFFLSGNMLQATAPPVSNVYQYMSDMDYERPAAHVKTWVEPQVSEPATHKSIPGTSKVDYNNRGIVSTTVYTPGTPQAKPRTIFTTSNTQNVSAVGINNNTATHYGNSYVSSGATATSISRVYSDPVSQYYNNHNELAVTNCKLPNARPTTAAAATPTSVTNTVTTKAADAVTYDKKPLNSAGSSGDAQKSVSGNLLDGTLNLVDGKLSSFAVVEQPKVLSKFPGTGTYTNNYQNDSSSQKRSLYNGGPTIALTRADSTESIVGILKKSPSSASLKGIDMRDSVEVARMHRQMSDDLKKRPKSGKKSVRFADLSDEEEEDILISSFSSHDTPKKINLRNAKGGRSRASSARVVSKMAKVPPYAAKPPRALSAGSQRATVHAPPKPKAVAHIIQSQEPAQTEQAESYYKNLQSELEKKVTIVNSNFMGKVASTQQSPIVTTNGNLSMQTYTMGNMPVQLKMTDASKCTTIPTGSMSTPQASIPYKGQPVYNENGMRIDRTPTDDEINQLWETVRTCLHPNEEENSNCSHAQSDSVLVSRQKAHVSSTVIDGGLLGSVGPTTRVGSAYQPRTASKVYQPRQVNQGTSNGYLKKYGLLQQRRQETGNTRVNSAKRDNFMPQITQSNTLPNKKEDVTESMNMFMMAEQLANKAIPEGQIQHAMDELQARQLMSNPNNNNKVPSALSIEEQRLIESLDRLNDKLKTAENKYPQVAHQASHQVTHHPTSVPSNENQSTSGFRGRRPISNHQRRHTDGVQTDFLLRAATSQTSQRQYR